MKRIFTLFAAVFCLLLTGSAQLLSWTPSFAKDADNIQITLDASKGNLGLLNYSPVTDVYVHVGVITNLSANSTDWRYSKFTWATTPALAQATSLGSSKWQYTITNIRTFFGVPAGETILKIAILFRNGAGTTVQRNADGSDMYIPVYDNNIAVRYSVPNFQPTYTPIPEPISKQVGDNIAMTVVTNGTAENLLIRQLPSTTVVSGTNIATLSANPTLTASGQQTFVAEATRSGITKYDTLRFFVAPGPTVAPLPAGVRDGINYEAGNTSVVLVLYAPGKSRVSVIGEFPGSNWQEQTNYVMNKTPDGNYWWLRITGLTPGQEYAFQYLVDGTLKTGDPYSEKVLDPWNDGSITAATYPSLKAYPTGLTTGIVSVLQTNKPAYNWTVPSFSRPNKGGLVIYEALMRDFLAAHDWQRLRDTLNYLQNLGVNAIQLMPVMEFDGNESWGYNPSYFLAPDKYYGPENTLRAFVDSCHRRGIAVILDIAMNHASGSCPLAALYWNSATNQPAANNPWFNVTATHPYSVFNDFNHESLQTRYFTSRVIEHWLQNYKIDGFRWDLSKGFTQTNSGSDVNAWSNYDASRIAIWKRYYDTMQLKSPGSYCILEHFAANSEEQELSNYGMLLWGNNATQWQEAAMGFTGNSNFEGNLFTVRSWNNPYLVGYMESHDEERLMYKNLQYGNSSGTYNVRDLNTALKRIELCGAFFYNMPGPKMLWQFGELGYDFSINYCPDGTINNNCRTSNKPIRWDYATVTQRKRVYDVFAALNKLRAHPWYRANYTSNRIGRSLAGGFKWLQVTTDSSNVCVVGNFDVTQQTGSVTFQNAGTWYDYLNGGTITATGSAQNITLAPGEYHVYVNRNLVNAVVTGTGTLNPATTGFSAGLYPNPASAASQLQLEIPATGNVEAVLVNQLGQRLTTLYSGRLLKGKHLLAVGDRLLGLPAGQYLVQVQAGGQTRVVKFVKQ